MAWLDYKGLSAFKTKLDSFFVKASAKGQANGVATLDANGKVPSTQLPSYVDDVLEYAKLGSFPLTGETGKIYVALDTNKTYRWSGSAYVEISASLALGTTSSTAYRGDYGNAAYTHAVTNKGSAYTLGLYKIQTNSEGHVTNAVAVEPVVYTAVLSSDTMTAVYNDAHTEIVGYSLTIAGESITSNSCFSVFNLDMENFDSPVDIETKAGALYIYTETAPQTAQTIYIEVR